MDLRNPRFPYAQHCPYFFHRQFLEVVKGENLAFARLEFAHAHVTGVRVVPLAGIA